jgi:ABC-type polysaccharide/polyol phosphate transport system ATPase subunit
VTSHAHQPADQVAVDIRNLGIRYDLRLTTKTTLKGSLAGFLGRNGDAPTHFWAIRHLTFQVDHGESLAVIGPNGAGKSTLLLALAGILQPSEGEVEVHGRVSTLLTLGAGFEAELSGRDNIDLAAAFLGIDHKEMAALAPSIIEFAAISPDILLLDEVLGTGDQNFRARSQARIRGLVEKAKAIVLVTHDLQYVTEFCNRAILLEKGQIVHEGEPAETVELYKARVRENKLIAERDAQRFATAPKAAG